MSVWRFLVLLVVDQIKQDFSCFCASIIRACACGHWSLAGKHVSTAWSNSKGCTNRNVCFWSFRCFPMQSKNIGLQCWFVSSVIQGLVTCLFRTWSNQRAFSCIHILSACCHARRHCFQPGQSISLSLYIYEVMKVMGSQKNNSNSNVTFRLSRVQCFPRSMGANTRQT